MMLFFFLYARLIVVSETRLIQQYRELTGSCAGYFVLLYRPEY